MLSALDFITGVVIKNFKKEGCIHYLVYDIYNSAYKSKKNHTHAEFYTHLSTHNELAVRLLPSNQAWFIADIEFRWKVCRAYEFILIKHRATYVMPGIYY